MIVSAPSHEQPLEEGEHVTAEVGVDAHETPGAPELDRLGERIQRGMEITARIV